MKSPARSVLLLASLFLVAGPADLCADAQKWLERPEKAYNAGHPRVALSLYEVICSKSVLEGCYRAGRMLESGDGVQADAERARGLYTQACSGGHGDACSAMADLGKHEVTIAESPDAAPAPQDSEPAATAEMDPETHAEAPVTAERDVEEWLKEDFVALPSRCSLDAVVEFYEMGSVALECRVAGERLHCCEIKWHRTRPERFSSFNPLDPPRDLLADNFGYKVEEPSCGADSLSLVLHGDEAVGWKDFTAEPDQRAGVRLPLDESCRLTSGTLHSSPERRLPINLDFSRANVRAGEPETQYEIGKYWLAEGRSRNAVTHFTAAARDGHAQAQYELARIFEDGAGSVGRYLEEADRLYALAAAQGLDAARSRKQQRDAVVRDLQEMEQQAEAGDAEKQYSLGVAYATGEAVDLDWRRAVHWLQQASDGGHAAAMNYLGMIYARGLGGVRRDEAAGRALLERSIGLGYDRALVNLARITYRGEEDVTTRAGARAVQLLRRAQQSADPDVRRDANYWMSVLDRDRANLARRNTVESRREQIDAMQRGLQGTADAAFDALQNMK